MDVSWCWAWANLAPEVMRYTLPETLHCWVVDRQPEVLNRAFAMGFLIALTTFELEKTLKAYPEFGRRVEQLAALRKRCAGYTALARFRDTCGLTIENTMAYVYEGAKGVGVIMADVTNQLRTVRVTLDVGALGHHGAKNGTLFRQDGTASPAGELLQDGTIHVTFDLPALEVAVWTVPCE